LRVEKLGLVKPGDKEARSKKPEARQPREIPENRRGNVILSEAKDLLLH
jgi:hypothetical protein